VTELPALSAVAPWPAGSTSYPAAQDAFIALEEGQLAKNINDITASILAIEATLGANPAGAHPSIKAALDGLNATLSTLQATQLNLVSEVATLSATPGPPNSFYRFTQGTPALVWTITHPLGRFPSVTVVDSAGTVVEGEIDYLSDSQLTITFSSAFAGEAALS
jgi:hypothetical protein